MTIRHASAFVLAWAAVSLYAAVPEKKPVLLELFTSLGCSSCPPADKLLAEIDRQQPVPGVRLIVLSEHVDYWNSPQWSDPFSSVAYSERQQAYDSRLGSEEYTPQLLVNGTAAILGSNWPKIVDAIHRLSSDPCIPVHVAATRDGIRARLKITVDSDSTANKAVVFLALARDRAESHVGGGENAGRDLSEVAVAYSLKQLGKIDGGSPFAKSLSINLPAKSQAADLRAIAFVRKSNSLQVIGADQTVF